MQIPLIRYLNRNVVLVLLLPVSPVILAQQGSGHESYFGRYAGKYIQSVGIETFNPAGIRIYDTTQFNPNWIPRTINHLHSRSKAWPMYRVLRFSVGDTLDPVHIYESERLFRKLLFIRDCIVRINRVPDDTNQVKVLFLLQDRFSLIPNFSGGTALWRGGITENNLLGYGHRVSVAMAGGSGMSPSPSVYLSGWYPLLGKSLIQLSGDYALHGNAGLRSFRIERPLISPLFRWGGGIASGIRMGDGGTALQEPGTGVLFKQQRHDVWVGHALPLKQRNNSWFDQFVVSAGFSASTLSANEVVFDSHRSVSVLASGGYTLMRRYRERYLFSWEQAADFSEGMSVFVTQGWINQQDAARHYSGLYLYLARNTPAGYVSVVLSGAARMQGVLIREAGAGLQGIYVSPQVRYDRYRVRLLLNGKFRRGGSEPLASPLVTDGRSEDVWQFNGRVLESLSRSSAEAKMVVYTPWKPFDMDIAPFLSAGFSDQGNWPALGITAGKITALGAGLILRSRKRAINVIRLSFFYYSGLVSPHQPLFRLSPFWVFDLPPVDFQPPLPVPAAGI